MIVLSSLHLFSMSRCRLFYESSGRSFLHWFLLPGVTTTITPSHCLTDQELEERACKREEGLYLSGAELLEAVNAVTDNNGKGKGKGEDTDGENDALQRSDRLQDEIARLEVELDQRERLLADKKRRRDMLCRAKEREETDDSPPSLAQPSFPSSALSSSSSAASGKGGSALSASRAVEESQQELHQLYSATEQLMKWLRGDGGNGEDKNGDDEDVSPLLMDANVHPYLVQEDLLCGAVKQCVCATTSTLLRSNNSDDLSLAEGKSNLTSSLSHHPQYRLCCKELGRLRQSETVGTALRIKSAVRLARAKAQLDAAKVWIIRFSAQDHHSSNTRENTRHKHAALHLQRTQRMVSRHLNHTLPALLEDLRKSASEGVTVRVLQSDYSDKEQRQVEVRSALARAEKEVVDCQARVLPVASVSRGGGVADRPANHAIVTSCYGRGQAEARGENTALCYCTPGVSQSKRGVRGLGVRVARRDERRWKCTSSSIFWQNPNSSAGG